MCLNTCFKHRHCTSGSDGVKAWSIYIAVHSTPTYLEHDKQYDFSGDRWRPFSTKRWRQQLQRSGPLKAGQAQTCLSPTRLRRWGAGHGAPVGVLLFLLGGTTRIRALPRSSGRERSRSRRSSASMARRAAAARRAAGTPSRLARCHRTRSCRHPSCKAYSLARLGCFERRRDTSAPAPLRSALRGSKRPG